MRQKKHKFLFHRRELVTEEALDVEFCVKSTTEGDSGVRDMYQLERFRENEGSLSTLEPVDIVKGDIEERPCCGCEGWESRGINEPINTRHPFVSGPDNL